MVIPQGLLFAIMRHQWHCCSPRFQSTQPYNLVKSSFYIMFVRKKKLYKCHGFVYVSMLKRIQELNCPFPQMSLDEIPNFPGDKGCFLGEINMFHHFSHGFIMFHPICSMFSLEFSIQKKTSPCPVQEQLRDVQLLRSTEAAFAALTAEGKVVAWGMAGAGGHVPQRVKAPPWGRKWPNWENLVRRYVCVFFWDGEGWNSGKYLDSTIFEEWWI